jgi:hypothetical protein
VQVQFLQLSLFNQDVFNILKVMLNFNSDIAGGDIAITNIKAVTTARLVQGFSSRLQ